MPDVIGSLLGGISGSGSPIGAAIVRLRLDSGDYQRELAAARGETVAGANQMGAATSKFQAISKAAFLGVGLAAVAGIGIAIKAGSDLNEQLNKTRVVFGDASKKVIEFSETTATSLGIAQSDALTAAGNFGQLFDAANLASGAAADMSIEMVQLAGDLGSFNNIPVAEALEKIRAGLSGEAEPLRQLGVFLNDARVEAEAFASGITKVGEEVTDADKIQARYNLILQDTTKAQGDFARTVGESLPNQLKVFKAELTDVAANLGIALLPIVLEVVKAFKLLVPILKFAADNLGLIIGVLAGFAAFKYLPGLLFSIGEGLAAIGATRVGLMAVSAGEGIAALGSSLATAVGPAAAFAIAFGGVTAAVAAWDPLNLVGDVDELRASMEVHDVVLGRVARSTNLVGESNAVFGASIPPVRDAFDELTHSSLLAEKGLLGVEDAGSRTADQIKATGERVKNFAHMTTEELKEWKADTKESIDTAIFALEDLSTDSGVTRRDVIGAFQMMADEASNFNKSMKILAKEKWLNDEFIKFLVEQGPEWVNAFTALTVKEQRNAQDAWEETTKKVDKGKESLDKVIGVLKDLDGKTSKHTVIIDYRYEGFDPTKPGMSAQQR